MGRVSRFFELRIDEGEEAVTVTIGGRCSESGVALLSLLLEVSHGQQKAIVLDLINIKCRRCCRGSVRWLAKLPEAAQAAMVIAARKGTRCLKPRSQSPQLAQIIEEA